jgi:hypothetical protein
MVALMTSTKAWFGPAEVTELPDGRQAKAILGAIGTVAATDQAAATELYGTYVKKMKVLQLPEPDYKDMEASKARREARDFLENAYKNAVK